MRFREVRLSCLDKTLLTALYNVEQVVEFEHGAGGDKRGAREESYVSSAGLYSVIYSLS